jgi:RNA polymerase sigma-70 factor (ECF subfamily)
MISHVGTVSVTSDVTDGELIDRSCAGDREAQDVLVRRHRRDAYLTALQLMGNKDDALDVAQEALLRLLRTLHRFDRARPVRPWLLCIVRNLVQDAWRKRRFRGLNSLEELVATGAIGLAGRDPDPETLAARRELQRAVSRAVGTLPEIYREAVVLRDYQGLSYAEIAAGVGIPLGTVMSRLHKARTLLREALAEDLRLPARAGGGHVAHV